MELIEAELLKLYVSENEKVRGKPAHTAIVRLAMERNLAGATAYQGIMGFGMHRQVHTTKGVAVATEEAPIVIEIVDTPEKIEAFLPEIVDMAPRCLITLERVRIAAWRDDAAAVSESAEHEDAEPVT